MSALICSLYSKSSASTIGQTEGATQLFPDHGGRSHRTPCPQPKSVWPIPFLGRGLHPVKIVSHARYFLFMSNSKIVNFYPVKQ